MGNLINTNMIEAFMQTIPEQWNVTDSEQLPADAENIDVNQPLIVHFDGCCRWMVTPLHMWNGKPARKDCPHYSSKGCCTQHWFSCDFKDSMEFVTTRQDLMVTLERYKNEPAFQKKICTVAQPTSKGFPFYNCSEGKGYKT